MPRRRRMRSTWGSNEPAGPGKRRLRYYADLHDGRGYTRHSKTIKGTRRDGDEELARIRVQHSSDRPVPTVEQAYDLWYLPDMRKRVEAYLKDPKPGKNTLKPQSMKQFESLWRRHVRPRWGDVQVTDIRYVDVQEWLDGMPGQTSSKSLMVLRQVLTFCVRNEIIDRNVADNRDRKYRIPDDAKADDTGFTWTLDELMGSLWPAVWGTPGEAAFILSAFGSCRTGESLAPTLEEIKFSERYGMKLAIIPIARQIDAYGNVSASGDLKNEWSPRTVVLPEPWSIRIEQLIEAGTAAGETWLSDTGLGEPLSQNKLRRALKRALGDRGIEFVSFRALRRSWRSWIATMGISPEILEKMMGHVGDGVTGRHYLIVDADLIAEEVAKAFSANPVTVDWDKLGQK